jgi:hypothetical protein
MGVDIGSVESAGTSLRNRDSGIIFLNDIPAGASVTRAVLVWAILFDGNAPSDRITFEGVPITAFYSQISQDLGGGESATIGYAADVTAWVQGNGEYTVSDAVNGRIALDNNPNPILPATEGATLFVFYRGDGIADNAIYYDFTYSATCSAVRVGNPNTRVIPCINSAGGSTIFQGAGPGGVFSLNDNIRIGQFGAGGFWRGGAPNIGPNFPDGNFWDTVIFNVTAALPEGAASDFTIRLFPLPDCVGISGVILQVEQ